MYVQYIARYKLCRINNYLVNEVESPTSIFVLQLFPSTIAILRRMCVYISLFFFFFTSSKIILVKALGKPELDTNLERDSFLVSDFTSPRVMGNYDRVRSIYIMYLYITYSYKRKKKVILRIRVSYHTNILPRML